MELTFLDVISWLWDHAVQLILLLSVFFEITKIKFNPISMLMNRLLKPVKDDMENMKKELNNNFDILRSDIKLEIEEIKLEQSKAKSTINNLIEANEMAEISRIRWEIIEFANTLTNGAKHTKDEYRHIKDDSKRYHALIEKYNLDNGIIDEEMCKINERYDENKNGSSVYF